MKFFRFNKWAYVNFAREVRKASWLIALGMSYLGYHVEKNGYTLAIVILIWLALQGMAMVIESIYMDDSVKDKAVTSNPESVVKDATGEQS